MPASAPAPKKMNHAAIDHYSQLLRMGIEFSATLAFAASGMLAGARKKLDPVGVCVVAFLAAFGGGTLRDLLLDRRPFYWVGNVHVVWLIFALAFGAVLFMRKRHYEPTRRLIQLPDALGLGLFATVGVDAAQAAGMPALICVLMGVITGVFGGVLRDIVCNEIPQAFSDHQPYALLAFLGGWLYLLLERLHAPDWLSLFACICFIAGGRFVAIWRDWRLPGWRT